MFQVVRWRGMQTHLEQQTNAFQPNGKISSLNQVVQLLRELRVGLTGSGCSF